MIELREQPKIPANRVLVVPDKKYMTDGKLLVPDEFDPQNHWSVFGQVVAVPEKLTCHAKEFNEIHEWLRGRKHNKFIPHMRRLNRHSLEYDAPMEVAVGDRVMFRYQVQMRDELELNRFSIDGQIAYLFNYDLLYAVVDKWNEIQKMLNGFLLVEPVVMTDQDMTDETGVLVRVDDRRKAGVGVLKFAGSWVDAYKGYPRANDQNKLEIVPGMHVLFDKRAAVRVEYKYHQTLNKGSDHSLLRLQRKDIFAYHY